MGCWPILAWSCLETEVKSAVQFWQYPTACAQHVGEVSQWVELKLA